ncbi:MAG TPA: TA system VapC family ribonuclease toxin [Acidobacteriaceae bacterium]|nr:TA system VapC family ribonuclease toxin [Acidobacteriaceae bacterium]
MTFLLDVNVLIALIDPNHIEHDSAHEWFAVQGRESWATCPLTENGVLRILGHPSYPNSAGTPAAAAPLVAGLVELPGHIFWPDNISLLSTAKFNMARLLTSGQVTDSYLLALASAHMGQLATFDRRLVTDAVHNGAKNLHLIG